MIVLTRLCLLVACTTLVTACNKKNEEVPAGASDVQTEAPVQEDISEEQRKLNTVETMYKLASKYKNGNKALAEFSGAKLYSALKMSPLHDGTICGKTQSHDLLFQLPLGQVQTTPVALNVTATGAVQASFNNNIPILFDLECNEIGCKVTDLFESDQSISAAIVQDCDKYFSILEDYANLDSSVFPDNSLAVEKIKTEGVEELRHYANQLSTVRNWDVVLTEIKFDKFEGDNAFYNLNVKLVDQNYAGVKICTATAEYRGWDNGLLNVLLNDDCKSI